MAAPRAAPASASSCGVAFTAGGGELGVEGRGLLGRIGLRGGELELDALDVGQVARRAVEPVGDDRDRLCGGLRAREPPLGVVERRGRLAERRIRANGCRVRGAERRRREPRGEPLDRRRGVRAPARPAARRPPGARAGRRRPRVRRGGARRARHPSRRSRAARTRRGRRCASSTSRRSAAEWASASSSRCCRRNASRSRARAVSSASRTLARGRGAELGVGERHLAFRLAHGRVGLHDQALGADLERAAVVERGTLASRAEAAEADDAARDRHGRGTEDEEGGQPPETFGHVPESRTCRCVVAGRRLGAGCGRIATRRGP